MAYTQVSLTTCLQRLADRYEGVPFWSATEATSAINEALRIWNALTGFWRTTYSTVAVPGDPYIALPSTLVQSARVTWNGIPLEPASLMDLDWGFPNWRGTTILTPGAPSRPSYWARVSLTLIAIYPADMLVPPNLNPNAILVNGVRETPILVNGNDFIDIGQETLNVLLGYAQHVLALKVGGQTLVASYPGWVAFLKSGAEQSRQFAASAFYRKFMGLDQTRLRMPPAEQVIAAADQSLAQDAPTIGGA